MLTLALWAASLGIVGWLAFARWHAASTASPGIDFRYFLGAGRQIAEGHSPYAVRGYVYPPLLALLLVPFIHIKLLTLWKLWLGLIVAAPLVGIAAFVQGLRTRRPWWLAPLVFAGCGFTLYFSHYYPMSRDLFLGQTDTLLFAALTVAAVAAASTRRGATVVRGVLIGAAGLIKVWPWAVLLSFRPSGQVMRRTVLAGAAALAVLAAVTGAILGWSALADFFTKAFHAQTKTMVSDSVAAMPQLLFSATGLARPLVVSVPLRVAATTVLVVWVVGLLLIALRTRTDGPLRTWNVLFCIILLIPDSHRQYAICVLPLLWWWVVGAATGRGSPARILSAVLVIWWIEQNVAWPYNSSPHDITALRFAVPFFGDLGACTASVLGAWLLASPGRPGMRGTWHSNSTSKT